jgi:hypothetical protein
MNVEQVRTSSEMVMVNFEILFGIYLGKIKENKR